MRRLLVLLALAACGGDRRPPAFDTAGRDTVATAMPATPDTGCAMVLPWRACSALERLEAAGLAPRERGVVRQPFFSVEGAAFALGDDDEVQTFVFADSVAAARESDALDSVRVAPPTMLINWRRRPTLMRSANLVAILLSDDDRMIERVSLALGAGLPAGR